MEEQGKKDNTFWSVIVKSFIMVWNIALIPCVLIIGLQLVEVTKMAVLPILLLVIQIVVTIAIFVNLYKKKQ